MKDSHGQTVRDAALCDHCKQPVVLDKSMKFFRHLDGDRDCGLRSREVAEHGGQPPFTSGAVTEWPDDCHAEPKSTTIVQDYREYTADEIVHSIVKFTEQAGWGDPANLGHWLGAAQRWAKERV